MINRRRFLQSTLASGVTAIAGQPLAAAASAAPTPANSFNSVPLPAPAFSYAIGDSSIQIMHPSSRVIEHEGRRGLTFTSIRGRAGLAAHTINAPKGSLSFWLMPLQEIAPAAQYPNHAMSNPLYRFFVFLSDREAVEDVQGANFCIYQTTDWYPGLTARFGNDDRWGHAIAQATSNYFEFLPFHWYQIAATWDREKDDYRLYANGVLVGASDTFASGTTAGDTAAPSVYFGNPGYAMGDLQFFDKVLTPDELGSLFIRGGGKTNTEIQLTLEKRYAGKDLASFTAPTLVGNGWTKRKTLSLKDAAQDIEFFHQGCGPCLNYTPEGLRITTPTMEDYLKIAGNHSKYDMTRVYLWTRDIFEGDLHVTAEFKIHKHGGLALWMFQAAGMQGEDFLSDYPLRSDGDMRVVTSEDVRNYHWEFYREMVDTRNDLVSHAVIKNPWLYPIAFQMENRRWDLDRWYRITFLQEKNRLRGAIDNTTIFDVTDNGLGNTGPVMHQGRVVLRLMMKSDMTFRNLQISTRSNYA